MQFYSYTPNQWTQQKSKTLRNILIFIVALCYYNKNKDCTSGLITCRYTQSTIKSANTHYHQSHLTCSTQIRIFQHLLSLALGINDDNNILQMSLYSSFSAQSFTTWNTCCLLKKDQIVIQCLRKFDFHSLRSRYHLTRL